MPKRLNPRWAVIHRNNLPGQKFRFLLSQPSGPLSAFVQGIWSATLDHSESLSKPLYADAGSGIIFNFAGSLTIDKETLPKGVIMLPVKKRAANIVLPAGAQLAGIRFLPAIGHGILGQHYDRPTLLNREDDQTHALYEVYAELQSTPGIEHQVDVLSHWAQNKLDFVDVLPEHLEHALELIRSGETPGNLSQSTNLSQRQTERHFRDWLGMTPKHFQRIYRIKKAIHFLRQNKQANLADVAHQFGFSDQAHMTREFRAIAHITPGQV